MRPVGFYCVMVRGSKVWEVGRWTEKGVWWLVGSEETYSDADFDRIGNPITMPTMGFEPE